MLDCRGAEGTDGYSCWDLNTNHVCDGPEDTNGDTQCNVLDCRGADGTDGADGADGFSCWDLDQDYVCDPAEDVDGDLDCTPADCRGADGADGQTALVRVTDEPAGVLDAEEVTDTEYLCNGLDGADGQDGENGADGAEGENGDRGDPGEDGADGATAQDGADGTSSLVAVSSEDPGENCAAGGLKVEVGLDADGSGQLDADEIDAARTRYVCNGADGEHGRAGGCSAAGGEGWGLGVVLLGLLALRRRGRGL